MAKPSETDRIEKKIFLRAPRARVWRALADTRELGQWFGVELGGPLVVGSRVTGRITDPEWAHIPFEITVERMEPERLLSWRWHPHPIDPKADYSAEPTTLVVFELAEAPGGTHLTVVESGFDALPPERRATAYRGNDEGWTAQVTNIERHVAKGS